MMNMETKKAGLNGKLLDAVRGGSLLDLAEEGIGYLFDDITDKIEDLFGTPDDGGCTGKQVMPGFNVY